MADVVLNGMQLWKDDAGQLHCTLFHNGGMIEVRPSAKDYERELGFYDENMILTTKDVV